MMKHNKKTNCNYPGCIFAYSAFIIPALNDEWLHKRELYCKPHYNKLVSAGQMSRFSIYQTKRGVNSIRFELDGPPVKRKPRIRPTKARIASMYWSADIRQGGPNM